MHTSIDNYKLRRSSFTFPIILFFLVFFIAAEARALTTSTIPSRDDIQNELSLLSKRSNLTEEEKLSVNDIEKALVFYDGIEKLNKTSDDLQKKINLADSESKQAINNLKRIKSQGTQVQAEFIAHLKTLSLAQLEAELNSLLAKLQTEQADLASFSAQLVGLQTQPELECLGI